MCLRYNIVKSYRKYVLLHFEALHMEMTLERAYCGVLTLTVATYSQSTTFPSGCMYLRIHSNIATAWVQCEYLSAHGASSQLDGGEYLHTDGGVKSENEKREKREKSSWKQETQKNGLEKTNSRDSPTFQIHSRSPVTSHLNYQVSRLIVYSTTSRQQLLG